MMQPRFSLLFALALCACGSSGGTPDAAANPDADRPDAPLPDAGPGTGQLLVEGTFLVENPMNVTSGTNLRVNCEVRVTKNGMPVENAQVRVNPAPPAFQTILTQEALDKSLYTGWYTNYADTARLTIIAGDDYVSEVIVRGPAMYEIEKPIRFAMVPPDADLRVTWSRPQGAVDSADVSTNGFSAVGLPDPGAVDIPSSDLATGTEDQLEVIRWRENDLGPGAAAGSTLDFGIRNVQPFSVQ